MSSSELTKADDDDDDEDTTIFQIFSPNYSSDLFSDKLKVVCFYHPPNFCARVVEINVVISKNNIYRVSL